MTKSREQLSDMTIWVGADGTKFLKICTLFADFEKLADEGNTDAAYMVNALRYVHRAMEKA